MDTPNPPNKTIEQYIKIKPQYDQAVDEIKHILERKLSDANVTVSSIHGRSKSLQSLEEKISRKNYSDPLNEITDLAGVRIVCSYESDLTVVAETIRSFFNVHEHIDKSHDLGVDKMGYNGAHFIVSLGDKYMGVRYEGITDLKCEIQIRTVLQDAWSTISHQLIYKNEEAIPKNLRRDLNNVASLLEIAQGVFDSIKEKRTAYVNQLDKQVKTITADQNNTARDTLLNFLKQPLDLHTFTAYTQWKFPNTPDSLTLMAIFLNHIDRKKYPTLFEIDEAVNHAQDAVEKYKQENPAVFKYATDRVTKSLGFVDSEFRKKHGFSSATLEAFSKYKALVQK